LPPLCHCEERKRLRGVAEANSELAVHKSQGPWSKLKAKEFPRCVPNRLHNLCNSRRMRLRCSLRSLAMTMEPLLDANNNMLALVSQYFPFQSLGCLFCQGYLGNNRLRCNLYTDNSLSQDPIWNWNKFIK
jgi:hypothetical protein